MNHGRETIRSLLAELDNQPPPIPFETVAPITKWDSCCLPDGMREAADAIANHVQAPLPLAAISVICAVGHVAQRLGDAERPTGGQMPSSLFALVLADSGDRKSECFRLASQPIDDTERELRQKHSQECARIYAAAFGMKKADKQALKSEIPSDPRTLYREGTVEAIARDMVNGGQPAMSLSTDEGGQFFGGHSMTSDTRANACGMLTRLFDGQGVERNRVGADSGSGFRYGVRFGLFIAAQQVTVNGALNDPLMRGQGLLPRFLFSAPESIAGQRLTSQERLAAKVSDNMGMRDYWKTLRKMNAEPWHTDEHGSLKLSVVPLDAEALDIWIENYNEVETQIKPDGCLIGIKAFAGRSGELARRLATVFAIWRHFHEATEAMVVDGTDMQRAYLLVKYSIKEWNRQQGGTPLTIVERDAIKLLTAMQKNPERWKGVSRSFIAQHCPNALREDVDRRNAAINELQKRHWLYDDGTGLVLATV